MTPPESPPQQPTDNCAHDGCKCTVPVGRTYCSEYCAKAAQGSGALLGDKSTHTRCQCGHPACA